MDGHLAKEEGRQLEQGQSLLWAVTGNLESSIEKKNPGLILKPYSKLRSKQATHLSIKLEAIRSMEATGGKSSVTLKRQVSPGVKHSDQESASKA